MAKEEVAIAVVVVGGVVVVVVVVECSSSSRGVVVHVHLLARLPMLGLSRSLYISLSFLSI